MKRTVWISSWIHDPQAHLFLVVALGATLALAIAFWPFLLAIAITLVFGCALMGLGYAARKRPILRRIIFAALAIFLLTAAIVWRPGNARNPIPPSSPPVAAS
jgi:hypothetical protein